MLASGVAPALGAPSGGGGPPALDPAETAAGSWIVAAQPRRAALAVRLARAMGARVSDPVAGLVVAPAATAARLSARLRRAGSFWYAEPDVRARRHGIPADPLSGRAWWPQLMVAPHLVPPAPGRVRVGVVEAGIDAGHPDLGHARVLRRGHSAACDLITPALGVGDCHGTRVTSLIGAPANGVGFVGVFPGVPTEVYATTGTCSDATAAVRAATRAGVSVINMSYGFDAATVGQAPPCYSHLVATQQAYGAGITLVAAAGNERDRGSRLSRPATDPHVLSVGAIDARTRLPGFSNQNLNVDLVAPGVDVLAATPLALDSADGVRDGYSLVSGTSYSAPLVSGIAAWLRAARPGLSNTQIDDLLRFSARDLGPRSGWDAATGWGLPDLAAALTALPAPIDRAEPNDDIEWVDGRRFGRADPPLLRRGEGVATGGALDRQKDAVDVVPVRLRAGRRLVIVVRPQLADVDVSVLAAGARAVAQPIGSPLAVAAGRRGGLRAERVVVPAGPRARRLWVAMTIPAGQRAQRAYYTLTLRSAAPQEPLSK